MIVLLAIGVTLFVQILFVVPLLKWMMLIKLMLEDLLLVDFFKAEGSLISAPYMRSLHLKAALINVCLFTCFVNLHSVMATKQKANL